VLDRTDRPPSLLAQPSYLASQVSKYGRRLLVAALAEHDLRLIDFAVLLSLDDFGARSQQQLADSLDFDKSDLVGRIDRLEQRELVTRSQDPADRRRNLVKLTRRGRALVRRLQPVALRSQEGFLDSLSPAEREQLVSLLRRVLLANDAARTR
jgi:MarR family transcriptional regulator, lower aerobic nicotinate degradation pathway regulator